MKLGEFICAFIRAFICARVHSMSKHFWKHAVVEFSQHTQSICWIGCFKPSDDIIRRHLFLFDFGPMIDGKFIGGLSKYRVFPLPCFEGFYVLSPCQVIAVEEFSATYAERIKLPVP